MKFTLLSNDKVKFKIKQRWDFTLSETIVDNSYCYDYIKYFASSIKNYNINIERVSLAKKALSFLAHKISFPKRRIKND